MLHIVEINCLHVWIIYTAPFNVFLAYCGLNHMDQSGKTAELQGEQMSLGLGNTDFEL